MNDKHQIVCSHRAEDDDRSAISFILAMTPSNAFRAIGPRWRA